MPLISVSHQASLCRQQGTPAQLWDKTDIPQPPNRDPTNFYNADDMVNYQGELYNCTIGHQSQASWPPTTMVPLWSNQKMPHNSSSLP